MYAPDGSKFVVLSYVDDFLYWYTSEELGKWFVDPLAKIVNVSFLVYAHWFMKISISQIKDLYTSVDQTIYSKSVVTKYLDTAIIKNIQSLIRITYLMM